MRITNSMITNNTKSNINRNKIMVDKYNNQMTTQKKISKASEDPVIAIRSLRLSTTLSHIDQYCSNISDAESWLNVTETALNNMKSLLTDIRTQCVNGSTDTLSADDRKTILTNLQQIADQVYAEGNADYTGRTVFTGYRTADNLTFDEDEGNTCYTIEEPLSYTDLSEHRYYSGSVSLQDAQGATTPCTTEIVQDSYYRLRLSYDKLDSLDGMTYTLTDSVTGAKTDYTAAVGTDIKVYQNEDEWLTASRAAGFESKHAEPGEMIFLKDSGELIMGKDIAESMVSGKAEYTMNYTKTGFESGQLRPEYYFNCSDVTDPTKVVTYEKEDQAINYTISNATDLRVNTQADEVFDHNISRDVTELIDIVTTAINAHEKVTELEEMMAQAKYADEDSQKILQGYLDMAKKEADYADDNLQKTYGQYITNFDNYMSKVNIAITNVGSTGTRLTMTKTRVENQQVTIEELKSNNEDRDISDIIIDYYASYYAYQSSLTAAGKINQTSLLDYI